MTALIYAALGFLGLNTGLMILIFCNFGVIKSSEGLPKGQAAWFLWVAGIAELIAAYFFFGFGDTLNSATFTGFGLFWMGLGTMILWGGDGAVLKPMAISYAIFAIALMPVYLSASYLLGILLLFLFFIFAAIAAGAGAKVLGSIQLITFIIALILLVAAVWASLPATGTLGATAITGQLNSWGTALLAHP